MTQTLATFNPLPWQVKPWQDTSPVLLLTGSAGGGKSRLAGEKIHGYLLRYPGAQGLMLRKTAESLTNSIVLFMQHAVIGRDRSVKHVVTRSRFEYANGSYLAYGGMMGDEQREKVRSIGVEGGLDAVWMEEADKFERTDFDEVKGRMRGKAASWRQIILTTNPSHPAHWIYQDLILKGGASVYFSGAIDNPHNPADYLESLAGMVGVLGDRLRDGKWVSAEGAVYDEFDPAVHIVNPFPIPADWPRYRVIDFGYTNPFCCLWGALDHDGRLFVYREIYMSQRIVDDHAEQINELSQGETYESTISDHDAEDRATLHRCGIGTYAAEKDVSVGIQAVQSRLRKAGDGKPRLYVMRNCLVERDSRLASKRHPTSIIEEFPAYSWPKNPDGKTVKENPIKINDHAMDALRYLVMHVDRRRMLEPIALEWSYPTEPASNGEKSAWDLSW